MRDDIFTLDDRCRYLMHLDAHRARAELLVDSSRNESSGEEFVVRAG